MYIAISLNAPEKTRKWLTERQTTQDTWKRKNSAYQKLISKMLAIGGDFVEIPSRGDAIVRLLADRGKKFQMPKVTKKVSASNAGSKAFIIEFAHSNPSRYRLCSGYALVLNQGISFWIKHYWIYDKQKHEILEFTTTPKRYYFGVILSQESSARLAETSRGP